MVQVGLPFAEVIADPQVLESGGGAGTAHALRTIGHKVGMVADVASAEPAYKPVAPQSSPKGPVPTV